MRLFSEEEFSLAKEKTLLPLKCDECFSTFSKSKKRIRDKANRELKKHFCSSSCLTLNQTLRPKYICKRCEKEFYRSPSQMVRSKNYFCSQSCSGSFNNSNKTHGTRRSKLEVWLEQELSALFPNLELHFNRKDAINSELDIYIPSLKLAFELNGIFHYEPIYGEEKLEKIQNNDERKFAACREAGISLCIIDTSSQKYVKPNTSQKYLDIILEIVNKAHG